MSEAYLVPNHSGPAAAVCINEDLCIGCNNCANICRIQTILPNPEKRKPPVVAYPDECWYCGCCVEACPTGALEMRLPINQRVMFKDKENGEIFRIGSGDSPGKTFFKPPYGYIEHTEFGKLFKALEQKNDCNADIVIGKDAGFKIGRFFGEKEEKDNAEKLVAFLKKIGFDNVYTEGSNDIPENVLAAAGCTGKTEADNILDIAALAAFIKRACVSNFTAMTVWNSL